MALLSLQGDTQLSETISKVFNFLPEIVYVIQRYHWAYSKLIQLASPALFLITG